MAHRKVVAIIPSLSGVPADSVQNTFHFSTPTPSELPSTVLELESMRDALVDFYNVAHDLVPWGGSAGQTGRVGAWLSGIVLQPVLTIKIYRCETEIAVGASGEPIITYEVALSPFGTSQPPLPTEVAACLSFKGVHDPAYPIASQRGRVYLGPLMGGNLVLVTAGRATLAPNPRQTFAAAGDALRAWSTAGIDWVVWSGKLSQMFPVAGGWVDDAFDTQRRRGTEATTRLIW